MDSQHPGSSKPLSLLNLVLSGVICMCRASLIFNSRFLLALSTNSYLFPLLMRWCCCQTCSAMTETFSSPLLQASWCSFTLCSSLLVVSPMHTLPQLQGILWMTTYVVIGIVSLTLVRCDLSVLLKTALPDYDDQTVFTILALSECPYQTGPTRLSYQTNPYQTFCPYQTIPTRMSLLCCPWQTNLTV